MAHKELDVQGKIRSSIKKDGGYCHKLTNRFTIGIPDLLIGLYPFMPCLAEVKDLGPVVDKFNLQIDVTPKQGHELKTLDDVYSTAQHPYTPHRHAAFVLVALVHRGKHRLVALSHVSRRLDHTYDGDASCYVERGIGGYYPIKPLLEWAKIGKLGPLQ